MAADPEKIAAAITAVELEIGNRQYAIDDMHERIAEHSSWISFLRNSRIPALNRLLEPESVDAAPGKDV